LKNGAYLNPSGLQGTKDITPYYPLLLSDAEEILAALKESEIIVDISNLKHRDKQRFLDLLCGAAYCLNKGICTLKKDAYLIVNK
jgi:FtsZ-interacting cell division protein YlmF